MSREVDNVQLPGPYGPSRHESYWRVREFDGEVLSGGAIDTINRKRQAERQSIVRSL